VPQVLKGTAMADSKVKQLGKAFEEIEQYAGSTKPAYDNIESEAGKAKKRLLNASDDDANAAEVASKAFQVITEMMSFLRKRGTSDVEEAYKDLKKAKETFDKAAKAKQRQ